MLTHGRVGRLGSRVASSARAPGGDERSRDHVCGLPEAGSGSLRAPLGATPSIRCGTQRSLGRGAHDVWCHCPAVGARDGAAGWVGVRRR